MELLKILDSELSTYSSYVNGDVYGYMIEEINDSCYGFYGYNFEKNGLLDYARDAIDSHIESERKRHQQKVKALIKHHVPIDKRQSVITP